VGKAKHRRLKIKRDRKPIENPALVVVIFTLFIFFHNSRCLPFLGSVVRLPTLFIGHSLWNYMERRGIHNNNGLWPSMQVLCTIYYFIFHNFPIASDAVPILYLFHCWKYFVGIYKCFFLSTIDTKYTSKKQEMAKGKF